MRFPSGRAQATTPYIQHNASLALIPASLNHWPTCNHRPEFIGIEIEQSQCIRRHSGLNRLNIRRFNMQTHQSAAFTANPILTLEDLGLKRTVSLDEASRGLAERSEAQIVRWVQCPAGALFFVLAQSDPSSGAVYIFDRRSGVFYFVVFNDQNWGGYSVTEYEALERTHRISRLAQRPWLLNRRCEPGSAH
jgi:hypothetical protein